MNTKFEYGRRSFVRKVSLASAGTLLIKPRICSQQKLNVLVLGGTNFLGPSIVNALISNGHNVTLFNRGITNPGLFPGIPLLTGDRTSRDGYDKIKANTNSWDLTIDVWPQNPNYVLEAIEALKNRTNHYMYVSSIAVYKTFKPIALDETAEVRGASQYVEGNYNENKVLCERVVQQHFPRDHTIIRPGAIVGDRDPGPFGIHLLERINNRNEMMAPDSNDPVQLIDAKDIGNFLILCAERKTTGIFNLVGPSNEFGYKDMVLEARKALNSNTEIHWITPAFLASKGIEPFSDIPFWIPITSDPEPGFYQISNKKAVNAGLRFTDFRETVLTSYESVVQKRYIPEPGSDSYFGLSADREDNLIADWKATR